MQAIAYDDMRRMILFVLALMLLMGAVSAESPEDVELSGHVNDYADVFTEQEEQSLAHTLQAFHDEEKAEFAVVTVDSLEGYDIESYTYQVAEGNLGDEEKDNGLLLLIAVDDKRYRFEVGRGLEPYLNDAKMGRIGRGIIQPHFKAGNYYSGTSESIKQVGYELNVSMMSEPVIDTGSVPDFGISPFWVMIAFFFVIMPIIRLIARGKISHRSRDSDSVFAAAFLASSMMRGGGRGGFGGGGFGGFGGGSFGGGGFSGGW